MKLKVLAVGQKMPAWVNEGVEEYAKRLPGDFRLLIEEVAPGPRYAGADAARAITKESQALLGRIRPQDHVVALDVQGKSWSSEKLAQRAQDWRMLGQDVVLLIGGPDGLSAECLARANERWSLSPLTLPHPLVRIVLAEQLYRAWTLMSGHPYHR